MRESMPRHEMPETEPKPISKDEVIRAYQKLIETGIKNPDDIDLDDENAKAANGLYDAWQEQLNEAAGKDEAALMRAKLEADILKIDAGFTDSDYLDEVLNDWLVQDEQNAEVLPDSPEKDKLLLEIKAAQEKIEKLLESQE